MTQFYPVLPTKVYGLLAPKPCGVGDYENVHFVHAPQVTAAGKGSEDLVRFLARHSTRVILDCFAYELQGDEPDVALIYEAVQQFRHMAARLTIVCPDVIRNGEHSYKLLCAHGEALSAHGKLMVVPHGNSLEEWTSWADHCLDFCQNHSIDHPMVGLPRYMCEWGRSTRYKAAVWLAHYHGVGVHLLGAGQGLSEVEQSAEATNVLSCDSTAPFAHAMKHGICNLARLRDMKVEMSPRWWDIELADLSLAEVYAIQYNIALWKEALQYGPHVLM